MKEEKFSEKNVKNIFEFVTRKTNNIESFLSFRMHWYQDEEEEEADLMFSPALLARRASESWIDSAPIEVSL